MRPAILMAGLLAACTTTSIPESNPDLMDQGRGVGFGDYGKYQRQQQKAAPPPVAPTAPVVSAEVVAPPVQPALPVAPAPTVRGQGALDPAIVAAVEGTGVPQVPPPGAPAGATIGPAQQTAAVVAPSAPFISPQAQAPVAAPVAPAAPAVTPPVAPAAPPQVAGTPGISDEQDFAAVSERETIESDAARLERLRLERTVVEAVPLPSGPVVTGPNIIEYALGTTNAVGEPTWRRRTVFAQNKYDRNCAQYATPDRAQEAFLALGGPSRDKQGLDPDGDGFACDWSPEPYRAAAGR